MKNLEPEAVQKILIVTLSNLGDVVLTLPVFESIVQRFPHASLDVVVGGGSAQVFEKDPRIRTVISYNKKAGLLGKWRFLKKIRENKYDLIVDLRRSLFGLLGGAKYRNSYWRLLPSTRTHRAARHLFSLKGIAPKVSRVSFLADRVRPLPDGPDFAFLREENLGHKKIVIACPGSKSDLKKWPADRYAKLLDRLAAEENCQIVLAGDSHDAEDARKIKESMVSRPEDLTGKTDFSSLVNLFHRARLVITNDSAPLHIADALRVPTLAIFGPTDPKKYGPRYPHSQVVRRQLFCSPCEKAQCRYRHECMTELGVDEVHRKALTILKDEIDRKNFKILLIRLDRIGDLVLSIPSIQAVRERFPNAFISVMTRPETAPLLEGHPAVDEVIPYFYEKKGRHSGIFGNFNFIREIVRHHFDLAFILHPSLRSYLVPWTAGIPYRVGLKVDPPFLLSLHVPDTRSQGVRHESEYTLDIIRAFQTESLDATPPKIYLSFEDRKKISDRLEKEKITEGAPVVVFHLGASCVSKRWPAQKFEQLADRLLERFPEIRLVTVGGKFERELSKAFEKKGARSVNWAGELSLKELAALLEKSELLISNDSGPVHISSAVGTPTLTLFGRHLPGLSVSRWRALGSGHEWIHKNVGCVVCLAHRCTIDFECLKAISVDEVFFKAEKMIERVSVSR